MKSHIDVENLPKFEHEFQKLANKAVRLGLPAPSYKIVGEPYDVLDEKANKEKPSWMPDIYRHLVDIEFSDVNVIVGNDWEAVGEIRCDETLGVESDKVENHNNALYYAYFGKELPRECYEKDPQVCEHCGAKRYRKLSYIIRNVNTNEYKQVGSSCVEDFVKVKNVEALMKWLENYTYFAQEEHCGEHFTPYIGVHEVMPYIVYAIKHGGYHAGIGEKSTMDVAMHLCQRIRVLGFPYPSEEDIEDARAEACAVVSFFKARLDDNLAGKFFNTEELNLAKIACARSVKYDYDNAGMLAKSVKVYNDELAREALLAEMRAKEEERRAYYEAHKEEIEAENARVQAEEQAKREAREAEVKAIANSDYYGEIGDEVKIDDAKITMRRVGESMYGKWVLLSVLSNEHVFKFFVNEKSKNAYKVAFSVREGDHISCDGKVKKHDEYNERKSTELGYIRNLTLVASV